MKHGQAALLVSTIDIRDENIQPQLFLGGHTRYLPLTAVCWTEILRVLWSEPLAQDLLGNPQEVHSVVKLCQ